MVQHDAPSMPIANYLITHNYSLLLICISYYLTPSWLVASIVVVLLLLLLVLLLLLNTNTSTVVGGECSCRTALLLEEG
jgi:hypothetical protein